MQKMQDPGSACGVVMNRTAANASSVTADEYAAACGASSYEDAQLAQLTSTTIEIAAAVGPSTGLVKYADAARQLYAPRGV